MKISKLDTILEQYNKEKGYFRQAFNEPHISKLDAFRKKLKAQKLMPEQDIAGENLIEFVSLILEKQDRTSKKQSSKTYRMLAECFGGYEVLEALSGAKLLQEEVITLIEVYPKQAIVLIDAFKVITKNDRHKTTKDITRRLIEVNDELLASKIVQHLKNKFLSQEGFTVLPSHLAILNLFKKCQAEFNEELMSNLFDLKDCPSTEALLNHISQIPELFTLKYLNIVLKLSYPADCLNLLKLLPLSAESFNVLLEALDKQVNLAYSEDLLHLFRQNDWPILPYLKTILSLTEYQAHQVHTELTRLAEKIKPWNLDKKLVDRMMKAVIAMPEPQTVDAFETLCKAKLYDANSFQVIASVPSFASGLARFYCAYNRLKYRDEQQKFVIESCPQHAEDMAIILEHLIEKGLHHHYPNINQLFNRLPRLNEIRQAVDYLVKVDEQFNQTNYSCLLNQSTGYLEFVKKLNAAANNSPGKSRNTVFGAPMRSAAINRAVDEMINSNLLKL